MINKIKPVTLAILTVISMTTSCSKDYNTSKFVKGTIEVNLTDATFESEETLGNRAATPSESTIQRNTIEVNKDFLLVAELRPQEPEPVLKDLSSAAVVTTTLATNTHYRVLVYTQAGAFVTERNYIRGSEAITAALELDGGTTYTFVVVSLNQNVELPATTPAAATRTLANSRIATTFSTSALMYYQQTMTVIANSTNRLDIVLKHRKPLISVTINSSQTGYNITAATGNFRPHNNGMLVNLADGTYTQNGTDQPLSVSFGTTGSQSIINTSTNYINSASNNSTIFTLTSITIGSITETNLTPFTSLSVSPGVRYSLILNIVPNDEYITHQNRPAARIGGIIWARHNLGVPTTVNTEQNPVTSTLHGNFYQFGRTAIVASGSATSTNSNWVIVPSSPQAWNSVDANPVKTSTDPCPTGYRVPSSREAQSLVDNTTHSTRGNSTIGSTNFAAASILTSKRAASVRLIFPHQGIFDAAGNPVSSQGLSNRGALGIVHTSRTNGNTIYRLRPASTGINVGTSDNNVTNYSVAIPIRCVGI